MMIQNLPARGGEKDHSLTLRTHEIRPGDDSKERGNHFLQAFRITTTGDLPAVLCNRPERHQGIQMAVPKGEVGLGVESRLPVQAATLGQSGPDSNPQRIFPHHLVVGVGL